MQSKTYVMLTWKDALLQTVLSAFQIVFSSCKTKQCSSTLMPMLNSSKKRRHSTEAISEYLHAVHGFNLNLATLTEHCRGYIWSQLAESFMGLEELNSLTISLWNTSHQDPKYLLGFYQHSQTQVGSKY